MILCDDWIEVDGGGYEDLRDELGDDSIEFRGYIGEVGR